MKDLTKTKAIQLSIRRRPRSYLLTEQQKVMKEAAEYCGIKPGITRAELVDKMVNCIPEYWRNQK